MAVQRDKDGKFTGSGGQSMENFVKMRENPTSAVKLTLKAKSQPGVVSDRNYSAAEGRGVTINKSGYANEAVLKDNDTAREKKFNRRSNQSKGPGNATMARRMKEEK